MPCYVLLVLEVFWLLGEGVVYLLEGGTRFLAPRRFSGAVALLAVSPLWVVSFRVLLDPS